MIVSESGVRGSGEHRDHRGVVNIGVPEMAWSGALKVKVGVASPTSVSSVHPVSAGESV